MTLAAVLTLWCTGSLVLAPFVGRAMRAQPVVPTEQMEGEGALQTAG